MKDLDFDELDKAVSSLAGGAKPISGSVPKVEPSSSTPISVSNKSLTPQVNATVTPGRRSARLGVTQAGKTFADITPAKPVPKAALRTAAPVTPASSIVQPRSPQPQSLPKTETLTPANEEPAKLPEPILSSAPPSPETTKPKTIEKPAEAWPDPLDFHEDLTAQPEAAPAAKKPASVDNLPDGSQNDLSTSPFLPDTKVNKRPLGAFATTPGAETTPTAQPPQPSADAQTDVATELESKPGAAVLIQAEEEKAQELAETTKDESKEVEKQVHESAQATIAQQYKTPEKTPDQTHRPVFDTKEYHPPLLEATVHGHKPAGGVGKVLLVLLILLLLALGGYFIFMYMVQSSL